MTNGRVTLSDVFEITSRIEEKMDKLGERVSALEVWRGEIIGKLTVVSALVSISFYTAVDWIRKKLTL